MGGRGGSSGISAPSGISALQGFVANARTSDLMGAWNTLYKKDMRSMTDEEKMARAVTTDELASRGAIAYDGKSQEFVRNTTGKTVVYDANEQKSYRVDAIKKESYGGTSTTTVADTSVLYGGKWIPVKNPDVREKVAEMYKKRKNK